MRILAETLCLDKCIVRKWCNRRILHLLYCLSKSKESYTYRRFLYIKENVLIFLFAFQKKIHVMLYYNSDNTIYSIADQLHFYIR